jgi:beta-lactamase regulating signal transducer with metallopeptidase domain
MPTEPVSALEPAALWLLALIIKATMVLALAGLATALLHRASAALRHLVWGSALAALLLLPIVSLILPWRVALSVIPSAPIPPAASIVASPDSPPLRSPAPDVRAGNGSMAAAIGSQEAPARSAPARMTPLDIATAVWSLGFVAVLGQLLLGGWLVFRIVRRSEPLDGPEWRGPLLDLGDRLGLPHLPRLVMASGLPMPFACGLIRAAIVLPRRATEWDDRRRRVVLCHELAHVRRADLLVNTIAHMAAAVYWFHPLVWVVLRRLRMESERACDDLVLSTGTRPSEYADHLLQIVSADRPRSTLVAAMPLAQRGEFEGRVLAILERGLRRDQPSRSRMVGLAGLALACVVPLAALAPVRRSPAPLRPVAPPAVPVLRVPGPRPRPAVRTASPSVPARPVPAATSAPDTAVAGVIPSLIRALHDVDRSVRENAAYALGHLDAASAVPELGTALRTDPDGAVREMTAWALGEIGDSAAIDALRGAVRNDADTPVRLTAAWALGQLGNALAVPTLAQALTDRAPDVRVRAAWALGTIGPSDAPSALIAALRDPSAAVRQETAWALGTIGDASGAGPLGTVLGDSDVAVRKAAIWALGRMPGDVSQTLLLKALRDADPGIRAQAARALGGGGPDPWPQPMPIVR